MKFAFFNNTLLNALRRSCAPFGVRAVLVTNVALGLAVSTGPAWAWDGVFTGPISYVEVTHGTNYAFRVGLTGVSTLCTGGEGFAYVNEADSNYKVYVATLLMAKAQGLKVTLYTNLNNGQCQLQHVVVAP